MVDQPPGGANNNSSGEPISFMQLAGALVSSVKDLNEYAKSGKSGPDKEVEQKLDIISQVMNLGFSMPANMALSMHQILVQLLTNEIVDIKKDFIIEKIVVLIGKVLSELRLKEVRIGDNEMLEVSMLEQIKWTLFVVRDRETAKQLSPGMTAKVLESLASILRAFSPLPPTFGISFLPGLSSVATKVISGDIKHSVKTRIKMVDLWQVALRNNFQTFNKTLKDRQTK